MFSLLFFIFLISVLLLGFFPMASIRIGTLNLNGAREHAKRASLFKLIELKHLDVMLIQETHSTDDNTVAWKRE